jgi:hypothetical protein
LPPFRRGVATTAIRSPKFLLPTHPDDYCFAVFTGMCAFA